MNSENSKTSNSHILLLIHQILASTTNWKI